MSIPKMLHQSPNATALSSSSSSTTTTTTTTTATMALTAAAVAIATEEEINLKRIVSDDNVFETTDSSPPPSKKRRIQQHKQLLPPSAVIKQLYEESGCCTEEVVSQAQHLFIEPTKEMIESYTMEASRAVRENDLETLQQLHQAGKLLNSCNKFGDTLLNIACRRSHTQIVKFLLEDANVSVYVRDDTGRVPLHDACWTTYPNYDIVALLLRAAPELALLPDRRGHTPFDYTRPNDWARWVEFLAQHKDLFATNR